MTKPLARRTFLRGAGAAIGLPFLEAMLQPMKTWAAAQTPRRFVTLYLDMGMYLSETNQGCVYDLGGYNDYNLPIVVAARIPETTLAALGSDMRNKVFTISGLTDDYQTNVPAENGHGTYHFLTRVDATDSTTLPKSLDQLLAPDLYNAAVNRFQYLTVSSGYGGYEPMEALSIGDHGRTMPFYERPSDLFQEMFAGFTPSAPDAGTSAQGPDPKLVHNASILDRVSSVFARLKLKLPGATDRNILDDHLSSIRDVEQRIQGQIQQATDAGSTMPAPQVCAPPTSITDSDDMNGFDVPFATYDAHYDTMLQLIALALECDLTRVVSYNLQGPHTNFHDLAPDLIPVSDYHDDISHTADKSLDTDPTRAEARRTIDRYRMTKFGAFMRRLNATVEANGRTILDNSIIHFGMNHCDSNGHEARNAPQIIAGSGGGAIRSPDGSNIVYPFQSHLTDFQYTLMKKLGGSATNLGVQRQATILGQL